MACPFLRVFSLFSGTCSEILNADSMLRRRREATASTTAGGGDEHDEITTETREISPAHYVVKIESFSLFSKNKASKYETKDFVVGDQKWRLIIYPNGDKSNNGEDHVSLYLAVSEPNPLKVGWEIHATVRFFVFDRIHDEYLVKEGKNRRFHAMKSKWGIPRFMPLKTFINPSNGYLVDDTCVFGVEVFVLKNLGLGECLTPKAYPMPVSHEWKISKFSTLVNDYYSEVFTAGNHNWQVLLYPRGNLVERNKSLSIYLFLADSGKPDLGKKVNVSLTIRLKGEDGTAYAQQSTSSHWFSSSPSPGWGWGCFAPLDKVQNFSVKGGFIIETTITILGTASQLPR